jgi:hypothetical protein
MTRDMDLIREILFRVEELPAGGGDEKSMAIAGHDFQEIWYHVRLAAEGGLLDVRFLPGSGHFHVNALTWEGHDFLEKSRNDRVWVKAKQIAIATGALTLDVLKPTLTELVLKAARLK